MPQAENIRQRQACVVESLMGPKRKKGRAPLTESSESREDHLERISELVELKGYARVTDVAAALGLTAATVSNMVRRLAARGFLNYERYRGFTLTAEGRAVAARIKARHKTLSELLEMLGLEDRTIEEEVEDIEHYLRPQTLEVIEKLVSYWKTYPDALQSFLRFARKKRGEQRVPCKS